MPPFCSIPSDPPALVPGPSPEPCDPLPRPIRDQSALYVQRTCLGKEQENGQQAFREVVSNLTFGEVPAPAMVFAAQASEAEEPDEKPADQGWPTTPQRAWEIPY